MTAPLHLALSTSTAKVTLALRQGERIWKRVLEDAPHRVRLETLMISLTQLYEEAALERETTRAVLVDRGPGSFTSLRIGVASANALGLAWGVPVVGFSSLKLIAQDFIRREGAPEKALLCGLFAGRRELHAAVYRLSGEGLVREGEEMLLPAADFLEAARGKCVVGWQLERAGLSGAESAPDAQGCFALWQPLTMPGESAQFVFPRYGRLPDAVMPITQGEKKVVRDADSG